MNLVDKILIVLESARPDPDSAVGYKNWLRLRDEAVKELHELTHAALKATARDELNEEERR